MGRATRKTPKTIDRYVFCRFCKNTGGVYGTRENIVLEAVLSQLAEWKMQSNPPELLAADNREAQIRPLKNKLQKLSAQRERIYEMLEQGVYTPQVFAERIAALDVQVADVNAQVEALSHHEQTDQEAIAALAPHIDSILSAYEMADTIVEKNQILKSVIARIEYVKEHMTTKKDPPGQYLKITVFPRHNVTSSNP